MVGTEDGTLLEVNICGSLREAHATGIYYRANDTPELFPGI